MKRISVLLFLCVFIFTSCHHAPDITEALEEFVASYGASGTVYSTKCKEGEEGYIDDYLAERLFGSEVEDIEYAIFLNTHLDYASECGAFLVPESRKNDIIELCQRRISLLDRQGKRSFIRIYGNIIFYSTMQDRDRAEHFADLIFKN